MAMGCEFTVICFDIANDKRRRRVVRILEAFGHRAQESVFEAWLDTTQRRRLERQLDAVIDAVEDRVAVYALPPIDHANIVSLGIGLPTEDFYYAIL